MVKGWTKNGQTCEKIYDLAWAGDRKPDLVTGKLPPIGSTVDTMKASYTNITGATQLKAVWTDPEFDPRLDAFSYARRLEIPTPERGRSHGAGAPQELADLVHAGRRGL